MSIPSRCPRFYFAWGCFQKLDAPIRGVAPADRENGKTAGISYYIRRARVSFARPCAEPFMIRINDTISIDESEISETFIRSSGPGGQNVKKLATAVQLRFDVRHSPSLHHEVRARLERLAGKRLTRDGVLVITAQRHRTQERNRDDALERLVELIRAAAVRPTPRRPTRPTLGSKVRRLEGKKRRSGVKALRHGKPTVE